MANVGIGALAVAILYQSVRGPSSLEMLCQNMGFTLTANEWEALRFLRDHTPREAVVLMPLRPQPGLDPRSQQAQQRLQSEVQNFAICGSLGGRATYIEYAHAPQDIECVLDVINLWQTSNEADFAARLRNTKATHLVEYSRFSPEAFSEGVPSCLEPAWESASGSGRVRIWKVKQADSDEKW